MPGCANRLDGEMRRSLYMLVAGILAFIRLFVLGVAAVSLGMTDFGGPSTAMLRIFQLYGLLFVYLLFLQYFSPSSREVLKTPCILISSVSPVLSVLAFLAFIQGAGRSIPLDLVKTGSSIFLVILMDLLILGLVVMDSLKAKFQRGGERIEHAQVPGAHDDSTSVKLSDAAMQSHSVPADNAPDSSASAPNSNSTDEVS